MTSVASCYFTYHLCAHAKPRQNRQWKCEAAQISSVQSVKSACPIAYWDSRGGDMCVGDSENENEKCVA